MNLDDIISFALQEDVGEGDHTSLACIPKDLIAQAKLLIKDTGILAGVDVAQHVFHSVDPQLTLHVLLQDGAEVKPGEIAFIVKGNVHSILKSERLVLNCMQRMSGIATLTRKFTETLKGLKTKALDTRKTTPGIRLLEKMAVKIGGGENHRFGLYDMILIKDNHIAYSGGIEKAIRAVCDYLNENNLHLKVEIEVKNLDELQQVLNYGKIDRIMLDNFPVDKAKEAVQLVKGRYELEVSGGINLENIRNYAECGVDFISVGALTHSVKSLDLSLKAL